MDAVREMLRERERAPLPRLVVAPAALTVMANGARARAPAFGLIQVRKSERKEREGKMK
jgi:hypothetical protein